MRNLLIPLLASFLFSGCSTQVLRPDLQNQMTENPQLVDFHDRWIFGIARKTHTDPKKACVSETPVQIRDFTSVEDVLIGLLTLGIYLPSTNEVWCVKEAVSSKPTDATSAENPSVPN